MPAAVSPLIGESVACRHAPRRHLGEKGPKTRPVLRRCCEKATRPPWARCRQTASKSAVAYNAPYEPHARRVRFLTEYREKKNGTADKRRQTPMNLKRSNKPIAALIAARRPLPAFPWRSWRPWRLPFINKKCGEIQSLRIRKTFQAIRN